MIPTNHFHDEGGEVTEHMASHIFEVGQTVYHVYTGKPSVINKISPSGALAFGDPPFFYKISSYAFRSCYDADRQKAQEAALRFQRGQTGYYEYLLEQAKKELADNLASIKWLEEQLAEQGIP
jgi:hypothetical protein